MITTNSQLITALHKNNNSEWHLIRQNDELAHMMDQRRHILEAQAKEISAALEAIMIKYEQELAQWQQEYDMYLTLMVPQGSGS
jgi:hypothetical protein